MANELESSPHESIPSVNDHSLIPQYTYIYIYISYPTHQYNPADISFKIQQESDVFKIQQERERESEREVGGVTS